MADNTRLNVGAGGNVVADDELDTVNGVAQSAPKPHAQYIKLGVGGDGAFDEIGEGANKLPVVDAAVATALGLLLTELGQKLEAGGEVALSAATLTALETIQIGNQPADPPTQTTLAAILTELGQKLETGGIVKAATLDFEVNTRDGEDRILTYTENGVDRTITRDGDGLIVSDLAD